MKYVIIPLCFLLLSCGKPKEESLNEAVSITGWLQWHYETFNQWPTQQINSLEDLGEFTASDLQLRSDISIAGLRATGDGFLLEYQPANQPAQILKVSTLISYTANGWYFKREDPLNEN